MERIIECIPNFSEGRNPETVAQIVKSIADVPGIFLLDQESDFDHNRSVITFAGPPEAVIEAAFQAIKKAQELIDLDTHRGEHPRMGATDVCPLVPLKGITEKEALEYAEKLAEKVGNELQIPVYLYEKSARVPSHTNLADVRKGEYEGIKKEITNLAIYPNRKPDFGPHTLGKAGAIAIGVREPLIAYNVNLNSNDLDIAKKIAKKIRFKDGGFPFVKALGLRLENKGIVQVSMNLTNYKITPPYIVFDAIKKEAEQYGVQVLESELIGLIPKAALRDGDEHYLQIRNFDDSCILEKNLETKIGGPKW